MTRFVEKSVVISVVVLIMSGCQSHQAKVDALQKDYEAAELKFRQDCSTELYNVPPKLSPKCAKEDQDTKQKLATLNAEKVKQ